MVEYLVQHLEHQQFFYRWPLVPREGQIALPTAPGLGVDLDEAKIEWRRALEWA
jgi:L-alanine-DL-glutamate epimerase-like enolase superfamily enzyme